MDTCDPLLDGAEATYNVVSDAYDAPALAFRDRISRLAVERLCLRRGARVLDVCCGTGVASLAAAQAVGSAGYVLGLDLAQRQLAQAQVKAASLGLRQVEFRVGNLDELPLLGESFDAVLCVFGIFFVKDMARALTRLWQAVKPGGVLAVTTWAERAFEPGNSAFWNAVRQVRPELVRTFPWRQIETPARLASLFAAAGVPQVDIERVDSEQPLDAVHDWWSIVRGSGYRAIAEQLAAAEQHQVCVLNLNALAQQNARSIEAHALLAMAQKSG